MAYTLPRKHETLSGYSKTELDKVESYLNENRFRLTPLTTWIIRASFLLMSVFFESSLGESFSAKIDQIINEIYGKEINFFVLMIIVFTPFYISEKICDKQFLKLALAYLENSKKRLD